MENKNQQSKSVRNICDIAKEISKVWKNVYFGAVPYLQAMKQIKTINDNYGFDSARDIINYFLCNATYWRGEDARRIKKELKELLNQK